MTLRVLMTADTIGGVWTYATELAGALAEHDVEITLVTMGKRLTRSQTRTIASLHNVAIVETEHALEWMQDPWHEVDTAGDRLLAIAARLRPDLVHVNGYAHAALPFGVPIVCVAHSCVSTWYRAVRGHEAGAEWSEYRRRARAGLLAATEVVAPTRAMLREVLAAYDVPIDGRVIPNGRCPRRPRAAEKESFVLAAGRLWDEAKGIDTLVASAPRLSWPVCVAGSTTPPPGIVALPIPDPVQRLGELAPDDLAAWMARASIYALPARYEPFGFSILEAALAGCALVLGDLATLRETWGYSATYVPPGDPEALAHAVETLLRDPLRRGGLSVSAHARALQLSPARMAAGYRALYDELVGAGHQEVA